MKYIKYIDGYSNGSGTELYYKNINKFKVEWKWLAYFTHNFDPSYSFLTKFDTDMKEIFRLDSGLELDWSEIFLMIVPISNQFYLEYDTEKIQKKLYFDMFVKVRKGIY
jgi:hypothetical protein